MNTGSSNGRGWGVIDFPRNQSACWESTVRPEQSLEVNRREVETVQREKIKEKRTKCVIYTRDQLKSLTNRL